MARILITNHGTHSAEKWAMTSAEMIFPLEDTAMVGERLIAAQKFQTKLAELLTGHHASVIDDEKAHMHADTTHFNNPLCADDYLDHAVAEVVAAAVGGPWEAHFAHADVQKAVRVVLDNHMLTAQHVERMWHAAHHESEHGTRYLAAAPLTAAQVNG